MKLSDLNIGEPYKIDRLERINTKYGEATVAVLDKNGDRCKIFLPKRFNLSKEIIDVYNSDKNKTNLIYIGSVNERFEIRFI